MTTSPNPAMRILVVEDEWLIADALEGILQSLGYSVLGPAATVDQALTFITQERPDAVLLDIGLGESDSLPVAQILAREGIPFVLLSGHVSEGLAQGYESYPLITKPVSEAVLRAHLLTLLSATPDQQVELR